jgi:hypothetical protein
MQLSTRVDRISVRNAQAAVPPAGLITRSANAPP